MMLIYFPFKKRLKNSVYIILFGSLLSSCAASYNPINKTNLNFSSPTGTGGLEYAYRSNVLTDTGNKKYANREAKRSVKLIAVEITNKTDRAITLRNDISIYAGYKQVLPVESSVIHQQLKQPAPLYLLWGLGWLTITKCENDDCSVTPIPVGLAIGLFNMGVASAANKDFLAELNDTNLLDRTIAPGETVKGLLGISGEDAGAIMLRLR